MTKKTIEKDNSAEENVNPEQDVPSLDLKDLSIALQLIDAGIQRGAYQPTELSVVGKTHGRIREFLEYQAKLQNAAKNSAVETGENT